MSAQAIQIEQDVPIPTQLGVTKTKYPFKDMKVGDSFVALLSDSRSTSLPNLQGALAGCAKAAIGPRKIATRKLDDGSGYRVWRIA